MRFWQSLLILLIVILGFVYSPFTKFVFAASGTSSFVGYWKLDETTQGANATDSSGYANTGTPHGTGGGPNPSTDVPYTTFPDARSASFNGSDQYIDCGASPNGLPSGSGARTIAGWIKATSFSDSFGKTIAGWGVDSGGQLSDLRVNTSSKIEFHGNGNDIAGGTTLNTGQWYHVATTVTSGGAVTLYVNGVQDGTGSVTLNTSAANCKIGRQPNFNGQYFNGLIDDVRIYSRVLSATEIADLAHGNHTTATWTGSSSSNFETAGNWDINAIPEPYTKFVIPSVSNMASLSVNETFGGVTINSGGILNLAGFNLTMNDYVSGKSGLATNSGTLIAKNSETLTNFVLPTNSGTVMYNNTSNATGLNLGNSYHKLIFNDSLLNYWKFDEGSGTTALDNSGYSDTGTLTGGPTYSSSVPTLHMSNPYSLQFDGSDDYVQIPVSSNTYSAFTFSAWVNPSTAPSRAEVADLYEMYFNLQSGKFCVYVNGVSGSYSCSSATVPTGSWTFVSATWDGTTVKTYVNNAVQSSALSGTPSGSGCNESVGAQTYVNFCGSPTSFFSGQIDDVRFYSRALSAGEIASLVSGDLPTGSLATTTLNNALTVGGDLVLNAGTLDVSGSNYGVNAAGNFENNGGVFTARSGTVTLNGTNQTITSGNSFYNLTKSVSSADTLTFGQNSISTTSGTMTLTGAASNLLSLRSSTTGTAFKINPQGSRSIDYVNVQDSNNINGTAIAYSANNVLGSNLTNWATPTPTSTPTPGSNSNSSGSHSSPTATPVPNSCSASVPAGFVDLYQVDPGENSVTLYFTPVSGADSYFVSYGTTPSANQYGASFAHADMNGAVAEVIGKLQPGTRYYFQVRAGNGCATGKWSGVVSGTTSGGVVNQNPVDTVVKEVAQTVNPPKKLSILSLQLTAGKSNVCSYTVAPGDSLWSIAQDKLSDGSKFVAIQELNNLSGGGLSVGQSLKLPCDEKEETVAKAKEEVKQSGVTLDVKVVSTTNQAVAGAIVTLHSKVQMAKTDKNGIAHFTDVEKGVHRVLLAYNGYTGEQRLTVDGSKKEQVLTLQVQMNNGFSSPVVMGVIGGMGVVIVVLVVLLVVVYRKRLKKQRVD